jgi:DNA ligase (NAD+)
MGQIMKAGNLLGVPDEAVNCSAAHAAIAAAIAVKNQGLARQLLGAAGRAYFELGDSPMTDMEFDNCCGLFLREFGTAYKAAGNPSRSDRRIGSKQDYPLLANFIDEDFNTPAGFKAWGDRYALSKTTYLCSPKYDGMCVVISYDRAGKVLRAVTRGDDGLGVDVTRMFLGETHFSSEGDDVPPFDAGSPFGIKYEAIMSWGDVAALSTATKKVYKNPRNTVAGIMASDDGQFKRQYITLAPLGVWFEGMETVEKWRDRLEEVGLLEENFLVHFTGNGERETPWEWRQCADYEGVQAFYGEVNALRESSGFNYMLDGIVVEMHRPEDISRMGGRCERPRWVAKYKFPYLTGGTKAISLDWDLGTTGRLTPVVNFSPVTIQGRTFSRASIANVTRFDELALCPGTPLSIEIRGDVIAWLDRAGQDPEGAVPFQEPEGAEFTFDDGGRRVFALVEPTLAGRVQRMFVKCGIKGIKEATIDRLVESGLIARLGDAFCLTPAKVAAVSGLGKGSADIICGEINRKSESGMKDWEILASLGITGIGRSVSKLVLSVLTLEELKEAVGRPSWEGDVAETEEIAGVEGLWWKETAAAIETMVKVEGIEVGRAMAVVFGVSKYLEDLTDLVGMHSISQTKGAKIIVPVSGRSYKIVVTGDLDGWERGAFKELVEEMGHKMVGSISKNVDILITNSTSRTGNKLRDAFALQEAGHHILILSEAEAVAKLGLVPPTHIGGPAVGTAPMKEVDLSEI